MMKVGVTGGIGSGKSTVCRLFAQKGIAVYDSDAAAKRLMQEDGALRRQLAGRFGEGTFRDGQLDRAYLAGIVFADPQALADLNALVHPVVMRDFDAWAARQEGSYVILESAILFEAGLEGSVDKTVAVLAPRELRIERTCRRDGCGADQVVRRIANNPLFDFSQPRVMAILNVTPDSFFAGSRMPDAPHVERRVREAVAEGASIIDVGGYSSRPGADEVSPGEEWRRVELGVEAVRRLAPGMAVSVDTFRSEVAARAIERFGPLIINDISAGELDPAMPAVAAKYGVPYIAMHMKGDPKTMQSLTDYKRDITAEVVAYFEARVAALLAAGIAREHLVLDPGFGFAKTTEQNYELLAGLHRLCVLGYPVLAGLSRKSMIYRVLGVTPAQSLAGTVALGWECLRQGAAILRVHDVREAVDTVRIFNAYVQNSGEICQMKK